MALDSWRSLEVDIRGMLAVGNPEVASAMEFVEEVITPQQPDGTLCGVCALVNLARSCGDLPLDYDVEEMDSLRAALTLDALEYVPKGEDEEDGPASLAGTNLSEPNYGK